MGLLTNDMTRLRDDIDALHNSREAFINGLMHNVAEMQSNFRDAHAEMSRELRQTLDDNEAKRMQESMDSHGQRITEITDRKRKVDETLTDFRNTHAEMASKTKDDLSTFVSNLKENVVQMHETFRDAHAEMSRELRQTLNDNEAKRMQVAMDSHGERTSFVSDLSETVAGMRQEFAEEIEGVHQAWFGQAPRERTTKKETKRKSREEEVKAEPEKPEELIPDDLTEIQGIGHSRQEILNEAGFYTFAQFAKSTPEDLKRALGEMSKFVDVEKWIEQAKELVEPE